MSPSPDTAGLPVVIAQAIQNVHEAANMPEDLGPPNIGETLSDLHERLLVTRAAMVRVSAVLGDLVQLRGRIQGALLDRKGELEEANAKASVKPAHTVLTEDYSSAQEKNARLAGMTISERHRVRSIEKIMIDVDAALEYSRVRHRDLDRAVRDIDLRMRFITYEPSVS